MNDQTLPNDAAIAAALGIEDFRVGRQNLRDEQRWRVGRLWIDSLWMLSIRPSFDAWGTVGVATAHGEEFRGQTVEGWTKAVLASGTSLIVQPISADPLSTLLSSLPLLRHSHSVWLDGIDYSLRLESLAIRGTIDFANPTFPELIETERTCWRLAEEIARNSANPELVEFANGWERYLDR